MQFARRIFHSISDPSTHSEQQKENTFVQANQIRAQYQIDVKESKYITFDDYLNSVELDPMSRSVVEAHKDKVGPYIYSIDLELKDDKNHLQWTIRKRFTDFITLDGKLYREQLHHGFNPGSIVHMSEFYNVGSAEIPEQFAAAAKEYLAKLLHVQELRVNSRLFNEFIELSLLPLPQGPRKYKEGHLRKKGGGRFKHNKLKLFMDNAVEHWNERWFMLTQQGIIYAADSISTKPREIILFDQTFEILYGAKKTGAKLGIFIMTPNRKLYLQGHDVFNTLDWIGEIQKVVKSSPYTKANRFRSFAPAREATHQCKWYVDAEGYYSDLCDTLLQAKSEIFITDWWLTPELMLKRPVKDAESEYRLDKVLGKVANAGVRVYVILYHEVKMMMYNDSGHAKKVLQSLSPNIIVLQHPSESFFNWSHHEKLVIIDQAIGFIGGLDLCLGRWDTGNHSLKDPASEQNKGETFFGQDYANPRMVDFRDVAVKYNISLINKIATPRMPFHDAMIKVIGPVVSDMARHFIQYYNHVIVDSYSKKEEVPLPRSDSTIDEATLRKAITRAKFQSGLRKIFLIRHMGGNVIIPYEDRQVPVENVHQTTRSFGEVDLLASHTNNDLEEIEIPSENVHQIPRYFGAVDARLSHIKEEAKEEARHDKDIKIPEFGQTGYQYEIHQIPRNFERLDSKRTHVKEEVQEEIQKDLEIARKKSSFLQKEEAKHQFVENKGENDVLLTGRQGDLHEQRAYNKLLGGVRDKTISKVGDALDKDIKIPGLGEINPQHALDNITDQKYLDLRHGIKDKENRETNIENPSLATAHKQDKFQRLKTKFLGEEKSKTMNPDQESGKSMLQLLFTPKHKPGTVACQMIRSASKWSLGLRAAGGVERSIQNAYVELIQNAKHFIYIENQFFMSGTAGKAIKNQIGKALLDRIEQAHARKEKFRVLVFLPLLPAFEGEVIDSKSAVLKIEMNWQYKTISRGGTSIYEELLKKGIQPIDYIQFYSLRTHEKMPSGEPVTELIYIHSKILVIDDDILLIGSANINDRSLQGNGDSEVAMVFQDSKKVKSMMGGQEVHVSEFVQTFRTRLLSEHLGLSEEEVRDPLTQEFMTRMDEITERNTLIYREVFACYPDDTVRNLKELNDFETKKDLSKYAELAPKIQGHVVWFPLEFLHEETLRAPMTTLERYAPNSTFI